MPQQTNTYQNMQTYLQTNKQAALPLKARADALCHQLFSAGDLYLYLTLLSRLHQYDYRNLLLIWDQYPQATCLAAYRVWESMRGNQGGKVLKDAYIGRGIQLLAPFTEDRNQTPYLTWYRVLQFDVSQTNVTYSPAPTSLYILDNDHLTFLSDAVRAVLGFLHKKSLLLVSQNNPALKPQLSYRLTSETVVIRSKESLLSRVQLMAEAMAQLTAIQSKLPFAQHLLFSQCFCHCLLTIWGFPDIVPAPLPGDNIRSVPEDVQPVFLDVLQKNLRSHDELTACAYHFARNEADAILPDEDVITFHVTNELGARIRITHRLTGIKDGILSTKGDNNPSGDGIPLTMENVESKVVAVCNQTAWLAAYWKTTSGKIMILSFAGALVLSYTAIKLYWTSKREEREVTMDLLDQYSETAAALGKTPRALFLEDLSKHQTELKQPEQVPDSETSPAVLSDSEMPDS